MTTRPSASNSFEDVLAARLSRRDVLAGSLAAAAVALGNAVTPSQARAASLLGFKGVPVSTADTVVVPEGHTADVVYAWGDPIADGPAFKPDASNTAAEQALQAGMHHDGMQF